MLFEIVAFPLLRFCINPKKHWGNKKKYGGDKKMSRKDKGNVKECNGNWGHIVAHGGMWGYMKEIWKECEGNWGI